MVTIELVTVDPCRGVRCQGCDLAERALTAAMTMLGQRIPGGMDSTTWRSLDRSDGRVIIRHHEATETGPFKVAGAPYVLVDDDVVLHGGQVTPENIGLAVARHLYPDGWRVPMTTSGRH